MPHTKRGKGKPVPQKSAERKAETRDELALRMKDAIAEEAKQRQIRKPKSVVQKSVPQIDGKTRDKVAALAGVSHDTIAKVEKIVTKAVQDSNNEPCPQTCPLFALANGVKWRNAERRRASGF